MKLKTRLERIEKALETPSHVKYERALAEAFRGFNNPDIELNEALGNLTAVMNRG